ncbi:MAG: sucrose synthase [Acidobacteria bacterium]|nr:sucrose synthase [Acidobacteriota bacterium]
MAESTAIPSTPSKNASGTASSDALLHLLKRFCLTLRATGETFFLADQIRKRLESFLSGEEDQSGAPIRALKRTLRGCGEIMLDGETAYAVLRPGVGLKEIVCIHPAAEEIESVDRGAYLLVRDTFVQGHEEASKRGLIVDFSPFFRDFPKVNEPSDMGDGVAFLSRRLSAQLQQDPTVFRRRFLDFLRDRQLGGLPILVGSHVDTPEQLLKAIGTVRAVLDEIEADAPYNELLDVLRSNGLEAGWGNSAKSIAANLSLLAQVMNSSGPSRLETLLERLPLIQSVLMVSPHGWFAQEGVLGKPDTGGQVTYVLDQARAMEHYLRAQFLDCGLDIAPTVLILTRLIPSAEGTSCGTRREKVFGAQNVWIVRAPFRDSSGEVLPDWISRFQVWPYLEQFAEDSKAAVAEELMGTPDLIIGNYSDGNLVAHRLAEDWGCTHGACVHALEKTKYLFSDLHWQDMESDYNFSIHFTADLLGYNSADCIVSSSYREVGGSATEMGMIESYELFSMPGLYRVQSGFDPRLARHNIVPPGASEEHFFPNHAQDRRVPAIKKSLVKRYLSAEPGEGSIGRLDNPKLPPIFTMARMDRIKNIPGLVEAYGRSETLCQQANLLIVSSVNDPSQSQDHEEIAEIQRTLELIETYNLWGSVRWVAARLDKVETGEIYRVVADRRGVFAQPALMETFGLTVVEAMACGLPVVVTCYGGPAEIVITGESGIVQDPNDHLRFAAALEAIVGDDVVWQKYAANGIQRVHDAFSWGSHARKFLRIANVHAYWNHVDVMNRQALDRYIHTLYHTVYRPRARALVEAS